ncbi:hypothetical protein [Dactylosporangium darangshiense]|uniref:hypothetical protein n=1 Tax=Dactylosporangium darangshiense TaxID=579108 RepID=UPI003643E056
MADALLHAVTLSRPVPPAGWTATAARLLPPARAAVRGILERYSRYHGYLHDSTDRLVRGLTCMLALDDAAETTALVGAVARAAGSAHPKSLGFPRAPRTAAAAVHILAGRGGDEPVRVLAALSLTVKNKALLGRVQEALQRLGALRGWDPGQAAELSVDDHGLDRDRRRRFAHEDYAIVLEIAEDKPRIRYERAGAPLRSAPAAVRGTPALAEAQELRKRVAATLAAEKGRVEGLLSQGATGTPPTGPAATSSTPSPAYTGAASSGPPAEPPGCPNGATAPGCCSTRRASRPRRRPAPASHCGAPRGPAR